MRAEREKTGNRIEARLKQTAGMTMAEMLIVVAIIVVLGGVAFIAVWNYQRSLAQVERDGIAREIFVAAQNHLTAAKGEGYLGTSDYGTAGTAERDSLDKVYYIAVNRGAVSANGEDMFGLMLPFGAIDETVRAGGSYIIRYQPETATVMDVFYCSTSGSPARFNHQFSTGENLSTEYVTVVGLRDTDTDNKKSQRRTYEYGGNSVLGWYGSASASALPTLSLKAPAIEVTNADKLYVTVTDPNYDKVSEGAMLQLIVEGASSGAKKAVSLLFTEVSPTGRVNDYNSMEHKYTIVLDDITSSGLHFAELESDIAGKPFIPGEDIKIQAVAYSTSALANIAYSREKTTNSLFDSLADVDEDGTAETAYISSIRHLENLDKKVSNLGTAAAEGSEKFAISAAVQTTDLDWNTFKTNTREDATQIYHSTDIGSFYNANQTTTAANYYPISPDYALTYDGRSHSISNITASADDAGLFGKTADSTVTSISNLELIDFSITGTTSAGALAGTLTGTDVTNVLARNSSADATAAISATGNSGMAGGLIGNMIGSTTGNVTASAASLIVSATGSNGTAGGLIGTASGTITGCYSGGHTDQGEYYDHDSDTGARKTAIYNVTATGTDGTAGGLVGSYSAYSGSGITYSYSTCSVSGTTSGGFVGSTGSTGGSTPTISHCYCTGLVNIDDGITDNAFIGSGNLNASSTDNHFYEIVNEVLTEDESGNVTAVTYKGSGSEAVTAFDGTATSFNAFVGSSADWQSAKAYDTALSGSYAGKYNLKTVDQLDTDTTTDYGNYFVSTHYGDWPAPEIFFENAPGGNNQDGNTQGDNNQGGSTQD